MQQSDEAFLAVLAESARRRVQAGYYEVRTARPRKRLSLARAIGAGGRAPVIAEAKFKSPSEGLLTHGRDVEGLARAYVRGGAAAISVLTEPEHFDGRLEYVWRVKGAVEVPVLMKDVMVAREQLDAADKAGADAVLLITALYGGKLCRETLAEMVSYAHGRGLETLVEVHDEEEYSFALSTETDVVGINNRDLRTLMVSLETSRRLLRLGSHAKPVICESGLQSREEMNSLLALGADGFLIGTALMKADDPEAALRGLTRP